MPHLLVFSLLASGVLFGQASVHDLLEKKTLQLIERADVRLDGILGVVAIDLTDGHTISYNGKTIFPQASSIKIPIMIQVMSDIKQGKVSWEKSVAISKADVVDSSRRFEEALKATGQMTVRQLVEAMIEASDNAATNKLIELVGMANVNRTLDGMQLRQTRLRRKMIDIAAIRP